MKIILIIKNAAYSFCLNEGAILMQYNNNTKNINDNTIESKELPRIKYLFPTYSSGALVIKTKDMIDTI